MIVFYILKESFLFAINSLKNNKLRTFLSLLGITFGIFTIISVLSSIDSLEKNIRESIATLGDDVVYIQKWPWSMGGDYPWWKYMRRPVPSVRDFEEVKNRSTLSDAVVFAAFTRKNIQYKDRYAENIEISAYTHDYDKIRSFEIAKGRYFSPFESHTGKNRAILGAEIAEQLFKQLDPVGKEIKIGGKKVVIIGIFKREGEDMFGASTDKQVVIPFNFARTLINIRSENLGQMIMVKAKQSTTINELINELQMIMRSIRRLKPSEEEDFALNKSSLISKGFDQIFVSINLAGWFIGGFSILVGAFGVANIMFVSVKEQTRIIGIQKAIGAKNSFILLQFLYEAIILSLIGGIIGLLFVFLLTLIVNQHSDFNFFLSVKNVLLGTGISIVIGILAGFIPARNASRLDPVVAMSSV